MNRPLAVILKTENVELRTAGVEEVFPGAK
jgi:hypothetical protein